METKEANGPVTAAEGVNVDPMESMAALYTSGIERLAEIQKQGLEIFANVDPETPIIVAEAVWQYTNRHCQSNGRPSARSVVCPNPSAS